MSTFYHAVSNEGEIVINDFPIELVHIIPQITNKASTVIHKINGIPTKSRVGFKTNQFGKIYILTSDEKYTKSYKIFKEFLNITIASLKPIIDFKTSILEKQTKITEELIHNLTSLNSYSIQDLFSLIPQESLTENINKQRKIIKDILIEKPNVSTDTILQLIKYNLAMKVEFSVFEKTMEEYPRIQKTENSIRKVILSVLQIFIQDFEKKKIEIILTHHDKILQVENDTLFVSLYYLFENALKYCANNTSLKIYFDEERDSFAVSFKMMSIRIEKNEINKLSEKEYRSENVKKLNIDGQGIGMYRIKKTLKFNSAVLEITPRISNHTKQTKLCTYEHNLFKIKFLGQQDWFSDK